MLLEVVVVITTTAAAGTLNASSSILTIGMGTHPAFSRGAVVLRTRSMQERKVKNHQQDRDSKHLCRSSTDERRARRGKKN